MCLDSNRESNSISLQIIILFVKRIVRLNMRASSKHEHIDPRLRQSPTAVESNTSSYDHLHARTLRICQYIKSEKLTPKKFLQAFLDSSHTDLASLRRLWGTETGWPSTMTILNTIKIIALESANGRKHWYDWILKEVSVCMFTVLS